MLVDIRLGREGLEPADRAHEFYFKGSRFDDRLQVLAVDKCCGEGFVQVGLYDLQGRRWVSEPPADLATHAEEVVRQHEGEA